MGGGVAALRKSSGIFIVKTLQVWRLYILCYRCTREVDTNRVVFAAYLPSFTCACYYIYTGKNVYYYAHSLHKKSARKSKQTYIVPFLHSLMFKVHSMSNFVRVDCMPATSQPPLPPPPLPSLLLMLRGPEGGGVLGSIFAPV